MSKISGKAFDFFLLKRLIREAAKYPRLFRLALLFTLLSACISPVRPALIQYVIDHISYLKQEEKIFLFSAVLVVVLIFETLCQYSSSFYSGKLGLSVVHGIRTNLFDKLLNFKLRFYDNTPVGTMVTRTVGDIQNISDTFSQGFLDIAGDLLKITVIVSVMFYTDWQLTLLSLSTIPVLFYATYIFKNAIKSAFTEVRNKVTELNSFIQEHISGMYLVQLFNAGEFEFSKFKKINASHRDANIRGIWHYSIFFPVVEILSAISIGIIVWWGSGKVLQHHLSQGIIVSFILYINMLFRPIRQLADRFNTLQMGMICSERVFKLMDESDLEKIKSQVDEVIQIRGEIEIRNLSFYYKPDYLVLKNLNLKIKKGEKIAIVGATGSGKTTLASLLTNLYQAQQGDIFLDSVNIHNIPLNILRSSIGVVQQEVFLFPESIYRNVTLNKAEIDINEVIKAAKEVGIHDFIMSLPDNYEFNVKERGVLLSSGQRQLLSFLRVYLFNPSIIILDEATSNVDSVSENLIQNATQKLIKGRTSIIIAHRLSTIMSADKIIVMDKGEIKEIGSHTELMELKGIYSQLQFMQSVNPESKSVMFN